MTTTHIRWMIRRDLPAVLATEQESFPAPWDEPQFIYFLRKRDCIGMVAEQADRVVGFMLYQFHPKRLHLLNFAVSPDFRRQGVGAAMITKLASKLSSDKRNSITLEVCEANLDGQLFFKSQGLRAVCVFRDFYDNGTDAYRMRLRYSDTFASIKQSESAEATQ